MPDKCETGLTHIYCGEGKGKTTAAMGLAARAHGYGLTIVVAQFLKSGDSSEINTLKELSRVTYICGDFAGAIKACEETGAQLLVLDEIIGAVNRGAVDLDDVIQFLDGKPEKLEVVMTGRRPHDELLVRADYVTEMKKIKHPFDKGIRARFGIEK